MRWFDDLKIQGIVSEFQWAKPVSMPTAFNFVEGFAVLADAVSEFLGFGCLKLAFSTLDCKTVSL